MHSDWWDGRDPVEENRRREENALRHARSLRRKMEAQRKANMAALSDDEPVTVHPPYSDEYFISKTSETAIKLINVLLDARQFGEVETLVQEAHELKKSEDGQDFEF